MGQKVNRHVILGEILMRQIVFVYDSGDLLAFDGTAHAEQYMEAEDVKRGCYELFDSAGNRLDVVIDGPNVSIGAPSKDVQDADRFIAIVEDFMRRAGVAGVRSLSAQEAASEVVRMFGFSR